MNVAEIFQDLAESRLLRSLIDQENLFFVGEEATINYLQSFFVDQACFSYSIWNQFNFTDFTFSDYKAIVIASVVNEHILYEEFKQKYADNLAVPLLKLFSDVFVNLQANCQLLRPSDQTGGLPKIVYAIASTPRSGSTFLCELLSSTQTAGFPQEDLRKPSQILTQHCQFNCADYLQKLMITKASANGVFGTKLISHFLRQHIDYQPSLERFLNNFNFVYLVRKDKVAQAVSIFLAEKTKTWHLYSEQEDKEYQAKINSIKIQTTDFERIQAVHQSLLKQEEFLEHYFQRQLISPLVIKYEKLVEEPEKTLNEILRFLKIFTKDEIVKVVSKYRYKAYKTIEKLGILDTKKIIRVKLRTQKITSDLSIDIIRQYKDKYL